MTSFTRRGLLGGLTLGLGAAVVAAPAFAQMTAEIYAPTAPPAAARRGHPRPAGRSRRGRALAARPLALERP